MQIRTQKVKISSTDIKRIYFEAFPKRDRMPFHMMVAMFPFAFTYTITEDGG